MLLGGLEVEGYSSGRQASDSMQGNAMIWDMGYGLWACLCRCGGSPGVLEVRVTSATGDSSA